MRSFFRERDIQGIFGASLLAASIALFLIVTKLDNRASFLILHFDAYRGIDLFGSASMLYWVWGVAFGMVVVNYLLASMLYVRDRFLSYIAGFSAFFVTVLLLIAISVIIVVN